MLEMTPPELHEIMDKDTLRLFMRGLQAYIKDRRLTQESVAEKAETTGVTMSKYIRGRGNPSSEWVEKVVAVLGVSVEQLVDKGRELLDSGDDGDLDDVEEKIPDQVVSMRAVDLNHLDESAWFQNTFASLATAFNKANTKAHFWEMTFEYTPIAIMVIRDGRVIAQNLRSREIELLIGVEICGGCTKIECDKNTCPILASLHIGVPVTRFCRIKNRVHKIYSVPLNIKESIYQIVAMMPVDGTDVTE